MVRAARRDPEEGFVRPEPETITAYVLGTATDKQIAQVREALTKSAAFRREILCMMEDTRALAQEDPAADKEEARRITAPGRREFLKHHGERVTATAERETFWAKIRRWHLPHVALPAAAAAAVILGVLMRPAAYVVADLQDEGKVPTISLLPFRTRGAGEPAEARAIASEPKAAALLGFRSLIERGDDGGLRLKEAIEPDEIPSGARVVSVQVVSESGGEKLEFELPLPATATPSDNGVTLWVLALSSRELYSDDLSSDRVEIPWAQGMGRLGCLTITYPENGKYRAVEGVGFEIGSSGDITDASHGP